MALNWRLPRRRTLILAGLGVHILVRAWTFLYFIPEIAAFMAIPPQASFSPELADRASLWGALGWIRRALIAATSVALLLALMTPARGGEPAASRARRDDRQPAEVG